MTRLVIFIFLLLSLPTTALCQSAAGERLTIEQAVELALRHNRLLQPDELEVEKAAERVAIARTRRLPQFEFDFLGLQTITPKASGCLCAACGKPSCWSW
jgi:outer membrane protein TolC